MDRYRDPDRNIGRGYVNTGEISRRAARIAQLDDAVPDEQAGHQQSCEEQQKGFAHSAPPFRIRQYGCGTLRRSINVSPAVKAGGSCVGWAGAVARSVPKPGRKPEELPR